MPEFKAELTSEQLPEIEFKTEIFDLQKKWNLDFPLYAAKCDGDKLLPLLIPRKDHQELDLNLTQIFNFYQINLEFPTRNPIL